MVKKGSITVFLTLVLSLVLALVCTTIQSARMAAARTQILCGIDIGLYSLFGQYDRNILDEYDDEEICIQEKGQDEYVIEGKTRLDDLEERFNIRFEEEQFETINGFLIARLEHIPAPDEKFDTTVDGYNFRILAVENKMISQVLVTKLPDDDFSEEETEDNAEAKNTINE